MGPTWGPPGSCRPQMGPMLALWALLSGCYMPDSLYVTHLSPDLTQRRHLTSIGNPIVEIRRSYDRLISTMGFPILVRWHLHIESGPCKRRVAHLYMTWKPYGNKDIMTIMLYNRIVFEVLRRSATCDFSMNECYHNSCDIINIYKYPT